MTCLGQIEDGDRYFWCPRCGSLKRMVPCGGEDTDAPGLVNRCRVFEAWCAEGIGWKDTNTFKKWFGIGIAESINVPGERCHD